MLSKLVLIPVALFVFSLAVLFYNYYNTGEFVLRDIDLKGGTLITIETSQPVNVNELERVLIRDFAPVSVSGLRTASGYGANIEVSDETDVQQMLGVVNETVSYNSLSVQTIGSELGSLFFQQVIQLLVV